MFLHVDGQLVVFVVDVLPFDTNYQAIDLSRAAHKVACTTPTVRQISARIPLHDVRVNRTLTKNADKKMLFDQNYALLKDFVECRFCIEVVTTCAARCEEHFTPHILTSSYAFLRTTKFYRFRGTTFTNVTFEKRETNFTYSIRYYVTNNVCFSHPHALYILFILPDAFLSLEITGDVCRLLENERLVIDLKTAIETITNDAQNNADLIAIVVDRNLRRDEKLYALQSATQRSLLINRPKQ